MRQSELQLTDKERQLIESFRARDCTTHGKSTERTSWPPSTVKFQNPKSWVSWV